MKLPKDIDIRGVQVTVWELLKMYKHYQLAYGTLHSERDSCPYWNPDKKSTFIESILLNYPLPPLYVKQSRTGDWAILDGYQRMMTLQNFVNGKLKLSNLSILTNLNDLDYTEIGEILPGSQSRIEDTKITVYVIKPSIPDKIVIDIINRINE